MNLEKCEVISTAEFGSTYQGTSDEYSDKDYFSLVIQPLEDTIFRNSEKSAKHVDDHRYYPVERFITLIGKGGFDNLLMLCAQLEQARDSKFNQEVLRNFYVDEFFAGFVAGQLKPLTYSVIGNIDRLLKKDFLSGKDNIKFLTFVEHLHRLEEALAAHIPLLHLMDNCDRKTICKVDLGCAITRKRDDVALSGWEWTDTKRHAEAHITSVKEELKKKEAVIKDYEKANQKRMDILKSDTADFLVQRWK